MSFRILSNIDAMQAQTNLSMNAMSLSQSVNRLSSGLQINTAADNAAGYAMSNDLMAQIGGVNQASQNAQDGISMLQTAQGALNSVTSILQTMNQLAVQASNGTLSSTDLSNINAELQQLSSQINNISTQTTFNGLTLLNGSLSTSLAATSNIQDGFVVASGSNTAVSEVDVSQAASGTTYTLASGAGNTLQLSGTVNGNTVSQTITVNAIAAGQSESLNFGQLGVNITVSSVAGETAANVVAGLTGKTVVTASGGSGSANLQVGPAASDTMTVAFQSIGMTSANMSALNTALSNFNSSQSVANAQALITAVTGALDNVNTFAGSLGAYQNRLQDTINNLNTMSQNLSASNSRIRNVDVASEMVNFTNEQILQQAGVAVLAQANQLPGMVLKLIG